jgi:hypothetical protein
MHVSVIGHVYRSDRHEINAPICLIATICFVSLWMPFHTVPNEPVPSFSRRVYWLAGLELGTGDGSGPRPRFSIRGEEDGERVRTLGCMGGGVASESEIEYDEASLRRWTTAVMA